VRTSIPSVIHHSSRRRWRGGASLLCLLLGVTAPATADNTGFAWQRDALFQSLEQVFEQARGRPLAQVRDEFVRLARGVRASLAAIKAGGPTNHFKTLRALEESQFRLAALAAAHEPLLAETSALLTETRLAVMRAAVRWPIERADVHEAIYRVVYGGRTAIEEALLQQRAAALPALTLLENIPSEAPSALIEGVRVHSGDIILSRGDAPTSALIARGNPFPGNFSHVALVHVDAGSGKVTVIESLIERGAVLTPADEFLKEKRYRLLLLRLRPDHPALRADPLAAHRAADAMREKIRAQRVPYDFGMNWNDPSRLFCSEVVHHAYRAAGVDLWAYKPTLTARGLVRWLGDMGVTNFTTLIPSDLEYDPRLAPVAEWRNADALRADRLDNITLDVLLEAAERGDRLGYAPHVYLPGGVVKLWSRLESTLGVTPTIPEGMTVATALRVRSLMKTVHPRLRTAIARADDYFRTERGYPAPYWTLTDLARQIFSGLRPDLAPALSPGG
jgi:hypothetical protein